MQGYEILSLIGSGGMGIVYKARHRDLRRCVAIKTVRTADLDDLEFLERFYAEAEAVARLQHPNIIQVFEIGVCEPQSRAAPPVPFIALELVDGGNVAKLASQPQPAFDAARLVEKLARAVHAAHQVGVIHRDLKPANVLLTRDGEPKIADFGLAKQIGGERDADGRHLTQAGMTVGTPEYMAPEQAVGAPPTPAVDVYALGVILYELLTARVPFRAATALETMNLAQTQDPESPRKLRPDLPRDLATVCLKCLEKVPARRYVSAEALADDLRRFLDGRTIQARPVGQVERMVRWCRRNPLPALSLAAVVAIFFVAFALVTYSYYRSEIARLEESHQRRQAIQREQAERWHRYISNIAAAATALEIDNVDLARRALDDATDDHRNWEWKHFHSRLDRSQHVLHAKPAGAEFCSIVAHGRRVMIADRASVSVWDTHDRRELVNVSREGIEFPHLSPDGRTLAYRFGVNELYLHDVDTNQIRARIPCPGRQTGILRFVPNGRWIYAGDVEGPIGVWDVKSTDLVLTIPAGQAILSLSFNSDNSQYLTVRKGDQSVEVIDIASKQRKTRVPFDADVLQDFDFSARNHDILMFERFPSSRLRVQGPLYDEAGLSFVGHTNSIVHIAESPDGNLVASGSRDQTVGIWNRKTGQLKSRLRRHRGVINHVAFSQDSRRLLSASDDHTIRIWDARSGDTLAVLHGHARDVLQAVFSADGKTIISASRDGTIRLWNSQVVQDAGTLRGHSTFVYGVAIDPTGNYVASASWDGTARVWDARDGRQVLSLPHHKIVSSVAFHPNERVLATRARDAVRLWNLDTGELIHEWNVDIGSWRDTRLTFSPQGDRLAAGCANQQVRVWDLRTRKEVASFTNGSADVRDVVFSPDGNCLAVAGDRDVIVWNVDQEAEVARLQGHTDFSYGLAFNLHGSLLASCAVDGTVRLWDTGTWIQTAVLNHGINVYGVAFTPDGSRLASACADNTIRLWDVQRRLQVADLRGHEDYVHQVVFSPDNTRLISASGDHTVRVWDTLTARERASGK